MTFGLGALWNMKVFRVYGDSKHDVNVFTALERVFFLLVFVAKASLEGSLPQIIYVVLDFKSRVFLLKFLFFT